MKTEKFQLRGKNSVCAEAFHLLRRCSPVQLRGNTGVVEIYQDHVEVILERVICKL
jgi:hypothetical protein